MKFPTLRLRRLRESSLVRTMVAEHSLLVKDLVMPLFVKENLSAPAPIPSMPGQFQFSPRTLVEEAQKIQSLGIPGVILFGIPAKKDLRGRKAFAQKGVIQRGVQAIKKHCPKLLVITDVCLCEYLTHGHCGHVHKGRILNDPTLKTLSRIALSHARAGADAIAPSDMMDGRVAAIRQALDKKGFTRIPIISYAVKYASALYAPFRQAAESTPRFGDRSSYQMNIANQKEALREAQTDLEEGADMLLVKPALGQGDILYQIKEKFGCPVGAFCVSGEYAMVKAAAQRNWLDEKKVVLETHLGLKRAGANFLISYWACDLAKWGVSP